MNSTERPRTDSGELAELSAALRAHVRRRSALGERRARPRGALASCTPAPAALAGNAPPAARPPLPHAAAPRAPALFAPLAPPPPAARPGPAPTAEPQSHEVRSKAAACADLPSLRAAVAACTACELCRTRTQTVFSDGGANVRVMFVGEAPGENEDLQGVPFVGRAGQLLTDIITKGMGLRREQVYIANVLKCRPPGNRDPSEAEKSTCTPWLDRQIELVDPQVIVPLGRHAANHVLGLAGPAALSMGALRGRVHVRQGRQVVPTFHPAYLLRSPSEKKECWKDIQVAMGLLGLAPAPKGGA